MSELDSLQTEDTSVEEAPKRRTSRKKKTETDVPEESAASEVESVTEGDAKKSTRAKKAKSPTTRSSERSSDDGERTDEGDSDATTNAAEPEVGDTLDSNGSDTEDAQGVDSDGSPDEAAEEEASTSGKKLNRTHKIHVSKDSKESSKARSQNNRSSSNDRNGKNHRQRRSRDNRSQREYVPSVSKETLEEFKLPELREKAAELNIDASGMKKAEMIEAIYEALAIAEGFVEVQGILDIMADGYGFLRTNGYLPSERDVYVGLSTIRRNGLRKGDFVVGQTRPAREGEKFAALQKVFSINDVPIDEIGHRPKFSDLTPVFPDERFVMEHGKDTITARVIDLAAPIGKGQRGLIVSPPKAGKTTVLKDIAASISANNPEAHLMCLLVDERPEEVTDMERSINGEVIASTFDMPSENHIAVAELVIERAKRLVEQGSDVVILLDSITRLARAYNLAQPASGRILSGGVDSTALYPPKRFLGAARNIENGGSLTILASALIDTGSKMDEVIFEEFKGTGNMELKLDRNLADRRIFPAIDPVTSGTRKEELLLDSQEAPLIWAVRRILANMNNTERSMDMLIKSLKQTETNQEFLLRTAKRAQTQGRLDENTEL